MSATLTMAGVVAVTYIVSLLICWLLEGRDD
jgi:hypothetical protein